MNSVFTVKTCRPRSTGPRPPCLLTLVWAAALSLSLGLHAAPSTNLLGAETFIRRVRESQPPPVAAAPATTPHAVLRTELEAFRAERTQLEPAEAARRWLEFADRIAKIAPSSPARSRASADPHQRPVDDGELIESLPPPAAWPELARAISARLPAKDTLPLRELGLRLLASELTRDSEARKRILVEFQGLADKAEPNSRWSLRMAFNQLKRTLIESAEGPEIVLKSLERQLSGSDGERSNQPLEIPNLVALVGQPRAESFLRRALREPNVRLSFEPGTDTTRLARRLALELVDELKSPPWDLACSIDSVELYEALDQRFRKPKNPAPDPSEASGLPDFRIPDDLGGEFQQQNVRTYYLLGLISKGRIADATAIARKLGMREGRSYFAQGLRAMEQAGHTRALDDFFHALLSQDPALPFWDEYVALAAKAGQTERMLRLARAAAAREDLRPLRKAEIRQNLYRALLAADAVEEGVQELRRLLKPEPDPAPRRTLSRVAATSKQLGLALARVGQRTHHPEWIEEGLAVLRADSEKPGDERVNAPAAELEDFVEILISQNRGAEAEAFLLEELRQSQLTRKPRPGYVENPGSSRERQALTALASLYHESGRSRDLVVLLEQAPWWGAEDLAELFPGSDQASYGFAYRRSRRPHSPPEPHPLAFLAAHALAEIGRIEDAQRITDALLEREPGLDRGYELLLRLKGPGALARLDELFARDPFEERPLLWKAHLLRTLNRLEEAETAARQAIAIDPSDGEQGPGDRLRAYAVLADIRDARGDRREADSLRQAVQAIRLSEQADLFYAAGLLKRAIQMYEESLKTFADAYCTQARLAVQLAEAGFQDEAEAHYRRAYELMPDSFGRVESHCFGCERAFEGERAQGVAETVFTRILTQRPNHPQAHYLLGYLRQEQQRFPEAATSYLAAVRIDPDYFNAWARLQEVSEETALPARVRDQIIAQLLRLDPAGRHAQANLGRASDLPALWKAVEGAQRRRRPPAAKVFALPAAQIEKNDRARKLSESDPNAAWRAQAWRDAQRRFSPGRAVLETPFVQLAVLLMNTGAASAEID